MNEYAARLNDGRIVTVFGWSKIEVPSLLETQAGITRNEIAGVRLVEKQAMGAKGRTPYVERQRDAA